MRDHEGGPRTDFKDEPLDGPEDAAIVELLRSVGKRDEPPADFSRELRATLHAEWQATLSKRTSSRRQWQFLGAAVAAVAVIGIGINVWLSAPTGEPVARIAQVSGEATWASESRVAAQQPVKAGDRLTTAGGRAAIAFNTGISLRLDSNTEVLVDSAEHVTVTRGAVYVDAGKGNTADRPLVLATPYGDVRHLGTQYEVRVLDDALRVSVREGRIELRRTDGSLQGAAGEQLIVSASGNVDRQPLAADAAEWEWAAAIAPSFEVDERPLVEFLVWAGRESGRDIVFASPASQAAASQVILRGSVEGLSPDQAIDAVLATTTLQAERAPGRVTILPRP